MITRYLPHTITPSERLSEGLWLHEEPHVGR
jgi:hypothetical protein